MHRAIYGLILCFLSLLSPIAGSTTVASTSADHREERRSYFTEHVFCTKQLRGEIFLRTELIFGLSRASGPEITEAEFQSFITDQVTPRFPEGLTVLSGSGQFKDQSGTIIQEQSKVLVLLYPFNRKSSKLVEEIRAEYKGMFQQQSVLRIDEQMCVSF